MTKHIAFIFTFLIISFVSSAQQPKSISGSIVDTTGSPIHDVNVKIVSGKDSLVTSTDATGAFHFANTQISSFNLTATIVGYKTFTRRYTFSAGSKLLEIQPIKLNLEANRLSDVVVVAINPVTVKEDTIEYKANAYKVREGAPVEDVIKKLPGVTVDKDGNITAQGKQISRVRVNGKDFFGGDVQTATQNLPADIIDNIQIIDDYGDQANITGNKSGEPEKIININVQRNKNKGTFGNATAAVGNEGRYGGSLFANNFHDERQIS